MHLYKDLKQLIEQGHINLPDKSSIEVPQPAIAVLEDPKVLPLPIEIQESLKLIEGQLSSLLFALVTKLNASTDTHYEHLTRARLLESKAIAELFNGAENCPPVTSTKGQIGHCLGAAGAIESIASILAMKHGIVPPTINHTVIDENINSTLNLTLNKAQKRDVNIAISNTFGFGGHNACVAFKKLEE